MGGVDVVEVRPSKIQGLGVFSLQPFEKGELVRQVNVVREVTPEAPLRPELGERLDHCAFPDGKTLLYGIPDRHLNHSCDPNAYEMYNAGRPCVHARRRIRAGEEITLDYNINTAGDDSWPCTCGAARCRGETLGSFFKLSLEEQIEYLPLLEDWFVKRHSRQITRIRARIN